MVWSISRCISGPFLPVGIAAETSETDALKKRPINRASTRENCLISPTPAGFLKCSAALLYDLILLAATLFAATALLLIFRGGQAFAPHDPVYTISLVITSTFFFGWFWTHGGQTLGMKAWKIRLVTLDGGTPGWGHVAVRSLYAMIGMALFGGGYLWMLIDPKHRSWQDIASRTRVIRLHSPGKDGGP